MAPPDGGDLATSRIRLTAFEAGEEEEEEEGGGMGGLSLFTISIRGPDFLLFLVWGLGYNRVPSIAARLLSSGASPRLHSQSTTGSSSGGKC